MAKFFYYPFGTFGDISTKVPDPQQPNGSVSYYAGYGSNYQLPLASGGSALPINRVQFNAMLNDITGAIQDIQTQGVFSWIGTSPSSDYVGNYPYPINALVYYTDGNIYQSLIANNQDVPGATLNWLSLSTNTGVPIGSFVDFGGITIPANLLLCDGSSKLISSYPALFNALTSTQACSANSTSTVTGLTSTTGLHIGFYVSGANVPSGTTIASIVSSTSVTLSQSTTGVCSSLTFAPWGGVDNALTTFNVPLLLRNVRVGSGGDPTSPAFSGATLASTGGEEVHTPTLAELFSHSHTGTTTVKGSGSQTGFNEPFMVGANDQNITAASTIPLSITNSGSSTAFNVMQLGTVVYMCIKAF